MYRSFLTRFALGAATIGVASWGMAQQPASPFAPPVSAEANFDVTANQDQIEVLNRGPIHEAFADQIPEEISASPVISVAPPEAINEVPPEVKPNDDAIWIPGYFMWSDTEEDYIWISGVWRVPPPGQRWTPGYWGEVQGGFQWVPGFWADAQVQQLNYLPYPPESLDTGPTSPAPSENHYWVSGCWQWNTNQYAWQPGYWNVYQPGWTWIPRHYVWSPRGAVFVGGYWDYPFANRGLIFAPIHYRSPIYRQPGYYYRPSYAISPASILIHLFVNTGRRHLYYGDYYGDRYQQRGYYGWNHYHRHHSYLPSFVYYQHHYRHRGVDFGDRLNRWHAYYDRHPDYRPAHTVADSRRQADRFHDNRSFSRQSLFTLAVNELIDNDNNNDRGRRYQRVDDRDRDRTDRDRSDFAEIRQRREQIEVNAPADTPVARADRNGRVEREAGERQTVAKPVLELPNYLNDADRRERVERQLSELRSRIPENALREGRGGADRETAGRGAADGENPNRGDRDRIDREGRDLSESRNPAEAIRPGVTRPGSERPETARPEGTQPEETRPDRTSPEGNRPEATRPDRTGPEGNRPEATRPDRTGPEVNRPEAIRPERIGPEGNRPEAIRPERTGPEGNRPERDPRSRGDDARDNATPDASSVLPGGLQRIDENRPDVPRPDANRPLVDPRSRERDSNRDEANRTNPFNTREPAVDPSRPNPFQPRTPATEQPRENSNDIRDMLRGRSGDTNPGERALPATRPAPTQPRAVPQPSQRPADARTPSANDLRNMIRERARSTESPRATPESRAPVRQPTVQPQPTVRPQPTAQPQPTVRPQQRPTSQPSRFESPRGPSPSARSFERGPGASAARPQSRPQADAPSRSFRPSEARSAPGNRGGFQRGEARPSRGNSGGNRSRGDRD